MVDRVAQVSCFRSSHTPPLLPPQGIRSLGVPPESYIGVVGYNDFEWAVCDFAIAVHTYTRTHECTVCDVAMAVPPPC